MVYVFDPDAATDLTELTTSGAGFDTDDDDRLAAFYSYPERLDRCWVRANMITSLDGGATDDGKSAGLAGPGDHALFSRMRQEADVVLVGASTVRIENYSGAQMSLAQRQERQGRGQTELPPIAIVTHGADFEHDAKIFTRTEIPPLIMTSHDAVADARGRFGSTAEVIDASGSDADSVDLAVVLKTFAERKLLRVLSEGGPGMIGLLIAHGLLDELCLSIAPILVGGRAGRIATGDGDAHTRMRRSHLLTDDDGYLYTRYVKEE